MRLLSEIILGFSILICVALSPAAANNIRGQIRDLSPIAASGSLPVGAVTVQLTKQGSGGLVPIQETDSTSDGYYFFFDVPPGDYVLVVNGKQQFPLHVEEANEQDVPPVLLPE